MKQGDIIHVKDKGDGHIWHPYVDNFGIVLEFSIDVDNNQTIIAFINDDIVEFYLDEIEEANEKM